MMEWNLGKKMTSGILFKEVERSLSRRGNAEFGREQSLASWTMWHKEEGAQVILGMRP